MKTRKCNKCDTTKPLNQFYKRSAGATPYLANPDNKYERICKDCRKAWQRKSFRTVIYGLTEEQYENMVEEHNGVCAICQEPPAKTALHVDHNHITGDIRGLLCRECNLAIGHLKDSTNLLMRAIKYLEKYEQN